MCPGRSKITLRAVGFFNAKRESVEQTNCSQGTRKSNFTAKCLDPFVAHAEENVD